MDSFCPAKKAVIRSEKIRNPELLYLYPSMENQSRFRLEHFWQSWNNQKFQKINSNNSQFASFEFLHQFIDAVFCIQFSKSLFIQDSTLRNSKSFCLRKEKVEPWILESLELALVFKSSTFSLSRLFLGKFLKVELLYYPKLSFFSFRNFRGGLADFSNEANWKLYFLTDAYNMLICIRNP